MINKDAILNKSFMALKDKFSQEYVDNQFLVGITGEIGSGKTFLANLLELENKNAVHGLDFHHIDYDKIGHYVLGDSKERINEQVRDDLAVTFGKEILKMDNSINREELRFRVFNDENGLYMLNEMMRGPMLNRLYDVVKDLEGVILFNAATLVEHDLLHVVNNNVVLVDIEKEAQYTLLGNRDGISMDEIDDLLKLQLPYSKKKEGILDSFEIHKYGSLWDYKNIYDSSKSPEEVAILSKRIINHFFAEKANYSIDHKK